MRGSLWRERKESLQLMSERSVNMAMDGNTFVGRGLGILVLPVRVNRLLASGQFHGASSVPTETLLAAKYHSGFAIWETHCDLRRCSWRAILNFVVMEFKVPS